MVKDLSFKRIATEEAFVTRDIVKAYRDLLARNASDDVGFNSLMGYYLNNPSERTRAVAERLEDLGDRRLADMDATGIAMQVLSLTSPGVQIFDAPTAVSLARAANDELAAAIAAHPTRYSGLAAISPQNPAAAAKELERGVRKLGLKGAIVNSHTHGEYPDDPKFWDNWRKMPAWEFSRFRAIAERGTPKLATPLPEGKTAGQQKIEDLDTCVRYTRELLRRL